MTAEQLVLAAAVMTMGAAVQGTVGFGAMLVAAPLLLLINTHLVPVPATLAGLAMNGLMLSRDRGHADIRNVRWAIVGLLPGTLAAGWALAHLDAHTLATLAGVLILVAVALVASGVEPRPAPGSVGLAGLVSGFMGTVSSVGGPPIALVYQRSGGPTIRSTLARFFLLAGCLAVVTFAAAGQLHRDDVVAAAVMVPGVALGFWISHHLIPAVDKGHTRVLVLTVSAASALALLARQLF